MENDKITAAWARKQAESILGTKIEKEIKEIIEEIKMSVAQNRFEINVTRTLNELTKKELAKRGFTLKQIEPDQRDQREHAYLIISW